MPRFWCRIGHFPLRQSKTGLNREDHKVTINLWMILKKHIGKSVARVKRRLDTARSIMSVVFQPVEGKEPD